MVECRRHRRSVRENLAMGGRRDRLFQSSGLGSLLSRIPVWQGVLVLGYHRIGDPRASPYDRDLYSTTPDGFARQLDLLARHAEIVPPSAVPELLRRRGRHVAITFDDGYRDNFEHALPALQARGLPAAFFLPTGFLDAPRVAWWDEIAWMAGRATAPSVPADRWLGAPVDLSKHDAAAALTARFKQLPGDETAAYLDHLADATGAGRAPRDAAAELWMSWDMVRELRARGMEIGGHTVDHPVLARLAPEAQRRQVDGCVRRLEEEIGERVTLFSYPVGTPDAFGDETRRCVRQAGIEAAFALAGGYARRGRADPLAVPRTSIHHSMSDAQVQARVALPSVYARW
jgi:peptidoglycan/xylan/chitin deacetylase (PgdA/CDA1 family)